MAKTQSVKGLKFTPPVVVLGIGDPLLSDRVVVRRNTIEVRIPSAGVEYEINRKTGVSREFREKAA
jgi:hypothetical protein